MNCLDFELLDNEIVDDSITTRDFMKTYHQQGAKKIIEIKKSSSFLEKILTIIRLLTNICNLIQQWET